MLYKISKYGILLVNIYVNETCPKDIVVIIMSFNFLGSRNMICVQAVLVVRLHRQMRATRA